MACGEPCDADAHKKKHDIFFKTLTWVTNPVSQEYVAFAKNWLAQHIKNTDFKYRYKLATQHKTPEPYIWNNEFEVFVSIVKLRLMTLVKTSLYTIVFGLDFDSNQNLNLKLKGGDWKLTKIIVKAFLNIVYWI